MEDTPAETETGCSAVGSLIKCATLNTDRSEEDSTTEPKFIFIHRPFWDAQKEQQDDIEREDSDEEDEDDEDEDEEDEDEHANYFACTASVNDRSEWAWTITEAGLERYEQLEKQAFNRDQDSHGLYIYNDFTAYGINEVVDNWLKGFNKEISKRTVSPYAVWAELEGFAMFSQLDYIHCWFQGDDCRGFAETIALVGKALLTGLQVLKSQLRPYRPENGGLRNISMVLALFVQFVHSWTYIGGDHFGETKWVSNLVRLAKEHNIEIKGPYKFHERNQKLLEPEPEHEEEEDSTSGDQPKKKRKKIHFSEGTWGIVSLVDADSDDEGDLKDNGDYSVKGWKASFKEYTKGHARNGAKTIGGTMYDITKMSKAQKREIESGGARFWF